ncbi:MAG: arsenate reductase ArsC [bacterium]
MLKVMFLCTGNSCRSQMAEGFARELGRELIEAHSAGLSPSKVNSYAVRGMKEIGIDISQQRSKAIDPDLLNQMDIIITLCGHAEAMCPMTPPRVRRIHWPIDDPVGTIGTEEEILTAFRKTRDEIYEKIQDLIKTLQERGVSS